jgi:CheY-like chemotaxis protein
LNQFFNFNPKGKKLSKEEKKIILIVDDDANIRAFLRSVVRVLNPDLSVLTVGSVEEAKENISGNIPLLVITDINFRAGEESGFDLIKWIRESDRSEIGNIPIIAITGNQGNLEVLRQMGETGVAKPFFIAVIADHIKKDLNI